MAAILSPETAHLKGEIQRVWFPRGIGPLTQMSGRELMFSIDDAPWIRIRMSAGLLPVRLRSLEIDPPAMSWMIRDMELHRNVIARVDGPDLKLVLQNPKILSEIFDAVLAIHSGIHPTKVG